MKNNDEKKCGKKIQENNFQVFRNFIAKMEMGDIKHRGEIYTWGNNREGEGFIQERLDRFFGSAKRMDTPK